MPKSSKKKPSAGPFSIRIGKAVLKQIRLASLREGGTPSAWIRDVALMRAEAVLEGKKALEELEELPYEKSDGGEKQGVWLDSKQLKQITTAAHREGFVVGSWIRAVAAQRAKMVMGKGKKS